MANLDFDLGVLERQLHQARQNAIQAEGYISREPGDGDARCNRVLLTEKGQQAVDDCLACLRRVSRRMYAGLTNEEQAVMRSFYLRMLDNLQPDQGAAHSSK